MPKEEKKKKLEEIEEEEEQVEEEEEEEEEKEEENSEEAAANLKAKAVKKAKKAGIPKGEAENIVGDISEPNPDNKNEVMDFLKKLDKKIDDYFAAKKEEENEEEDDTEEEKTPKKKKRKASLPVADKKESIFGFDF